MQSKVSAFAATPDPTFGQKSGRPGHETADRPAEILHAQDPDLRLVIEEDQVSGSYVYKTVNRMTGEVILSLPRDELLRLREEAGYVAGQVIRAKA